MTSRQHRPSWSWLAAVALSSGVLQVVPLAVAQAEEDSATETAAARSLAVDGLKLAQVGKCEEAIPKLERAEKLHHSAIVLSRLGECQVNVGKLVEGTEMLRKVLREPLPVNPSPALGKAYERAQTVLDSAKPKIAALTISVSAKAGTELRLTVDGAVVASALVDSEFPVDPGEHVIEASAPGFLKASATVSLAAADKKAITLKLEADPNAPAPALANLGQDPSARPSKSPPARTETTPAVSAAPPEAPPRAPSRASAYVSWGVGGVGVGVGAAFGLVALSDKHALNGKCEANTCPASQRDAVDAAKKNGNLSTIAFGVGGAGLLLGTILYFSIGSGSADGQVGARARSFAGLQHGRALVGPGSVQLAADF
jgi:hypothetical protein